MITNDTELRVAGAIGADAPRARCPATRHVPVNPRQFALLAEYPEEEIRCLQEAIDPNTGRNELAKLNASAPPERCVPMTPRTSRDGHRSTHPEDRDGIHVFVYDAT